MKNLLKYGADPTLSLLMFTTAKLKQRALISGIEFSLRSTEILIMMDSNNQQGKEKKSALLNRPSPECLILNLIFSNKTF